MSPMLFSNSTPIEADTEDPGIGAGRDIYPDAVEEQAEETWHFVNGPQSSMIAFDTIHLPVGVGWGLEITLTLSDTYTIRRVRDVNAQRQVFGIRNGVTASQLSDALYEAAKPSLYDLPLPKSL